MNTAIKNISRYLILVIIPAYFFVLENSISNRHTHVLPNGLVVSHAHPLGSKEKPTSTNHEHTTVQFFFFKSFDNVLNTLPSVILVIGVVLASSAALLGPKENRLILVPYRHTTGRSPPFQL